MEIYRMATTDVKKSLLDDFDSFDDKQNWLKRFDMFDEDSDLDDEFSEDLEDYESLLKEFNF